MDEKAALTGKEALEPGRAFGGDGAAREGVGKPGRHRFGVKSPGLAEEPDTEAANLGVGGRPCDDPFEG